MATYLRQNRKQQKKKKEEMKNFLVMSNTTTTTNKEENEAMQDVQYIRMNRFLELGSLIWYSKAA